MVWGTYKTLNWTGGGAVRTEDGGNTTSWVQAAVETQRRRRRQLWVLFLSFLLESIKLEIVWKKSNNYVSIEVTPPKKLPRQCKFKEIPIFFFKYIAYKCRNLTLFQVCSQGNRIYHYVHCSQRNVLRQVNTKKRINFNLCGVKKYSVSQFPLFFCKADEPGLPHNWALIGFSGEPWLSLNRVLPVNRFLP